MASPAISPNESTQAFQEFCLRVQHDPKLLDQLRDAPGLTAFKDMTVALGRAHGFQFTAKEVHAGLSAARLAWIDRWNQ